ncbi:MAG: oligosaccharide flippase family protein [Armatimonadetes bacterium]|nr:oligosaccharide flippase family protein [Akkermansiaceae bacterium]
MFFLSSPLANFTISNYRNILKASSITGGAQAATLIIGIVRTKLVAVLLGSGGLGLIGLYQSLVSLIDSITNLGLTSSGVRELAAACGAGDTDRVSTISLVLKRSAWIIGLASWLLTALFAVPIALWTFQSSTQYLEIAALGGVVLLTGLTATRNSLLQANQLLRKLALCGIYSALLGAGFSILLYWNYGKNGIVASLFGSGLIAFGCSVYFSKGLAPCRSSLNWKTFLTEVRKLASIGIAFMLGGILMAIVAVVTRGMIIRELGVAANGLYQAAFALASMFGAFVLNAMVIDYFPRLSSVSGDNRAVNCLVNHQTEIGVLLALPGLIATLAFAPLILQVFYTAEFLPASRLLVGLFVGCFAQVVGWPLGFVGRAKGEALWVIGSECSLILFHLAMTLVLLPLFGLFGVALAFASFYFAYVFVMWGVARRLSGFQWSRAALRIVGFASVLAITTVLASEILEVVPARICGVMLTCVACLFSARGIALRLGADHRLVRRLSMLPGWRLLRCKHP